jgi:hypothetical protein
LNTFDAQLLELADRVNRNVLDHRSPESWHVEKNAIWVELKRLAGQIGRESGRRAPSTTWRTPNGR